MKEIKYCSICGGVTKNKGLIDLKPICAKCRGYNLHIKKTKSYKYGGIYNGEN